MNIYYVNRYSKLKGPFDIIDSNRQHIIKVGDICLRDTIDGVAFYVVYILSNSWNSCKLVGFGTNDALSDIGNTLLFSFDGLSRRKGDIALIKQLALCFREKVIYDYLTNAVDILEYKKDFWDASLYPQFFASSQELIEQNEVLNSEEATDKNQYPSVFAKYLSNELLELLIFNLNKGYDLKEAYLILREKHSGMFRKALMQFLTENPSGNIFDKPTDAFVPTAIVTEVEAPTATTHDIRSSISIEHIEDEPLKRRILTDHFLIEIGREPLLSDDEEIELAQKIRKGEAGARNKLVMANLQFVVGIVKQHLHKGLEFDDLLQEGFLGLIRAAERFDETRGLKFINYAAWWIKRFITDAINTKSLLIKVPLNVQILHRRIWIFKTNYEQKNGYLPPITEIDVDDEDNLERISFLDSLPDNLKNTCIPYEDLDVFEDSHNDILDYEDNDYNAEYVKTLLSHLSQREQGILRKFYGIDVREETLESIGKFYGLTRERARQIKEKAIVKLHDLNYSVLKKNSEAELRAIHFDEEVEAKTAQAIKETSIVKEIYKQIFPNSKNDNTQNSSINETGQIGTKNNEKETVASVSVKQSDAQKSDDNNASTDDFVIDTQRASLSTKKIYEVFNNTVSTYKYYWFISILQMLDKDRNAKIFLYNITARMVANAWRQITCYRLSFGSNDSLHKITRKLQLLTGLSNEAQIETVYDVLTTRLEEPQIKHQLQILTKNVPSRFLTPWTGSISKESVCESECIYSLIWDDDNSFILISPLWCDYIEKNYEKLIDFSYQKLALFLQKRNPNVKNILSKLKKSNMILPNTNYQGYTIFNSGKKCGIFDANGVQVFSSTGRIKESNSNFYRYYYTYSSFTVNLVDNNEEMRFSIGKRIINASHQTPLYNALDEKRWFEQIDATIYKEGQGYIVKVSKKWYDEFGNNLRDKMGKSTSQAITQDNANEIDSPTLLSNNEINKSSIKTEEKRGNVSSENHTEFNLHREKKTAILSYNSREFRWNVGDFVTLGLVFSGPITIQEDPYFLFRRNILFVFMKSRTAKKILLDSYFYLLPTDTQIFKKKLFAKYGRRTPRILLFIYESQTAVQFLDEVKIRRIDANFIRFESLL